MDHHESDKEKTPNVEQGEGEKAENEENAKQNSELELPECSTSAANTLIDEAEDLYSEYLELNDVVVDPALHEERQLECEAHSVSLLKADFHERGESFRDALLRFNRVFKSRFPRASANFFLGELSDAVQEVFGQGGETGEACASSSTSIRTPVPKSTILAIYLHCDSAVACNLFPERVFSGELITELLANNCILWGWDVSAPANYDLLQLQMHAAGLDAIWERVMEAELEHYPLLIAVRRADGPPVFLIEGDASCEEAVEALLAATDSGARPLAEVRQQIADDEALARQFENELKMRGWREKVESRKANIPKSYPPAPLPLAENKHAPVDDRHMVREGVATPSPPVGPPTPIVGFNRLKLFLPIAGIYSLYFHPMHMSFAGPADPHFHFSVPYTNILRIFFLRHPFHHKSAYYLLRLNRPVPNFTSAETGDFIHYVLIEVERAEVALEFNVDGCQSVLPQDFLTELSSGKLTTVGPVFDRLGDVLQLLSRRPLTVSYGFISSLGHPMVQCASIVCAGFLYPLESGLVFASLAPMCADLDEIVRVEASSFRLGDTEFNLTIVVLTSEQPLELFRIPNHERKGLLDFLRDKGVEVKEHIASEY